MNNHETLRAGKLTLTLAHGCRLDFIDAKGLKRSIDGEPNVIRLFRAMQLGSGKLVETIKSEGTERNTNVVGTHPGIVR